MYPNKRPGWALAADVLAAAFLVAGTIALFTDDFSFRILGVRVSIRTPWRPYLSGLTILVIRNWRRFSLARLAKEARDPLPLDERALFGESGSWPHRIGALALLLLGFSMLVIALTWPQIRRLDSVADLGDPLFYVWRNAWINHQLTHDPLALFHANQFHPERFTLTYSESSIVPALMTAPLFWIGLHPVVSYNILLLSGFVLSGVTMFLLVRALTGRIEAAMIAGAIFALYPYRFEHYSHLDLQMTMWMPLTLWALHRTMAGGRLGDGLATGLTFALQMLSSLYYGLFLAVYIMPIAISHWLGRGCPRRPIAPLAAGAVLAAVVIAPVASQYIANRSVVGTREESTIQFYSAQGSDYLKPHFRSLLYNRWSEGGHSERQLFPRLTPLVLTGVALYPPLSVARIAYVLALVVAVDGSFGFNGATFTSLHAVFSPFKGLRAPARFSLLVGMTLAILAGYGAARLLERWPRKRVALTAAMLTLVIVEALPRLTLERVWPEPPAIYGRIAGTEPPAVLAEFPMPRDFHRSAFDARYLYFSTFHWQKLVNGTGGFFPASYIEVLRQERDFPSEEALNYLRSRGVQYLTMHGRFTSPDRYRSTVSWLDARADLELVAAAPWEGAESRLYRLK